MSKLLFHKLFGYYFKSRLEEIESFINNPTRTQMGVFFGLLNKSKDTLFGNKYDFKNIKTIKDFQNKVPLSTYEDIFPYIKKAMDGGADILWPGRIKWFAKSSGTTNNKSKFIPVTKDSLKDGHFRAGKYAVSLYLKNFPKSKIFKGRSLFITGSLSPVREGLNIKAGDVSAVLYKNSPKWLFSMKAPKKNIALLSEWEEKADLIIENARDYDVSSIYGTPTWVLVLIEKILKKNNTKSIFDVWPNLEVFFHGAVSFVPYRNVFSNLIGEKKINYVEVYNATEGFFAVQDDLKKEGEMLLLLDVGIFYEFIPMEVFGTEKQYALTLDKVEVNKNYAIVISTNGGLFRYILGDTVKFTTIRPFRIKITGRTKHFINAFGEEVIVDNVEQAIADACDTADATVKSFTVAPLFMNENKSGHHEWVIEFSKDPENKEKFFDLVDQNIKDLNSDYEAKRKGDVILGYPIFHIVPKGTFYEWMKQREKLGGQHKVPRLSNDRSYVEEILKIVDHNKNSTD